MKRVTILVNDIGEPDFDNDQRLTFPGKSVSHIYIPADSVISVEDHVESLPTELGARFWGQLGDAEPQWWFLRKVGETSRFYVPMRGGLAVHTDEAPGLGLVRLPDPEPTEAVGR